MSFIVYWLVGFHNLTPLFWCETGRELSEKTLESMFSILNPWNIENGLNEQQ